MNNQLLKKASQIAILFLLPGKILAGNFSYHCKYYNNMFFNLYNSFGYISCYSKVIETVKKPKKKKPDEYQMVIRIQNKDKNSLKIYLVPKLGSFFHDGETIKNKEKSYVFRVKNNDDSKIYVTAQNDKVNYTAKASAKLYFGSEISAQGCSLDVKFKVDEDDHISEISCLKNFIMKPCYEKYRVGFDYTKNTIDLIIYSKDSSHYVNDGSC